MLVLLALLWCVYLSDCFVRLPRHSWIFRGGAGRPFRGRGEPDLQLAGGSVEIAWTPLLPWQLAYTVSGADASVNAARRRVETVTQHLRWLKIASGTLFVWVMGVLSVLVLTDRLLSVLLPWAIVGVAAHAGAFVLFLRAYTRIHGERPALETWLTLALSPVSLMRAPVVASLAALRDVHPAAAAAALCDEQEFLRIGRLWYFDAPDMRTKLEQLARSRDLGGQIVAPPARNEPGVSHYCPRCHNTYKPAARQCSECAEMALMPLEGAV